MYKGNIEARSRNHCCRGNAISVTCSQCVFVALVIQHAKLMRRVILSYVVWRFCNILFCTLSQKRHDFERGGKEFLDTKCDFISSTKFA